MRITKFEHACVRIEYDGKVVVVSTPVTSPTWVRSTGPTQVLITHEHPDHYDPERLRATDAPIYTIEAVAKQIRKGAPDVAERVTVVEPRPAARGGSPRSVCSASCMR